jgi:AAA domain, putative AbiEii toxin, Type IV TA system
MLIEFSVSNFRSFRERQTFSMVAAPRLRKRENVFEPRSTGEKLPALLKVAVIYGPNASGKSNLLKALGVVQTIAMREPITRDVLLPIAPFLFDPELADKPSKFELHFIHDGVRYQFDLAATSERINHERLLAFPKGRESLLYERTHSDLGETYRFGPQLNNSVSNDVLDAWKKLTPSKLLFIAQAVANSSEELTALSKPFKWITASQNSLLNGMDQWARVAQQLVRDDAFFERYISSFLREIDIPVSKIRVEKALNDNLFSLEDTKTILTHKTALGEGDLDFKDESEGTKNLIGFWLPWFSKDAKLDFDRLTVVDELDSSLHPKIVAALVEKHVNSAEISQLIFTTHDTHLMDTKLLRRDQIWVTERDGNGATQLRSIHDFEGRESEDIEKRYYEGRYRGLPFIKRR